MLVALSIVGRESCDNLNYIVDEQVHGEADFAYSPDSITIKPQANIGKYRADFLVTYKTIDEPFAKIKGAMKVKDSVKTNFREYPVFSRELIVECDGHNFHDKTKEQASKDRERDRALQCLGFQVFRFTGSDIWNDIFTCALEVINFLTETRES